MTPEFKNRMKQLIDLPIDDLRGLYPEETNTRAELVKLCKDLGLTKADLIARILEEEFQS